MAKMIFGMLQSLDGFVDHEAFNPDAALFRHFIDQTWDLSGSVYGRRLYDIMRYWDEDHPEWTPDYQEFAAAWRSKPKWVVSRTSAPVGPNATLVTGDVEAAIRKLKNGREGRIDVGGPDLAACLTEWGLVDEYQIHLFPAALGSGKPFFAKPPPALRLVASERIGESVIRLIYVPA